MAIGASEQGLTGERAVLSPSPNSMGDDQLAFETGAPHEVTNHVDRPALELVVSEAPSEVPLPHDHKFSGSRLGQLQRYVLQIDAGQYRPLAMPLGSEQAVGIITALYFSDSKDNSGPVLAGRLGRLLEGDSSVDIAADEKSAGVHVRPVSPEKYFKADAPKFVAKLFKDTSRGKIVVPEKPRQFCEAVSGQEVTEPVLNQQNPAVSSAKLAAPEVVVFDEQTIFEAPLATVAAPVEVLNIVPTPPLATAPTAADIAPPPTTVLRPMAEVGVPKRIEVTSNLIELLSRQEALTTQFMKLADFDNGQAEAFTQLIAVDLEDVVITDDMLKVRNTIVMKALEAGLSDIKDLQLDPERTRRLCRLLGLRHTKLEQWHGLDKPQALDNQAFAALRAAQLPKAIVAKQIYQGLELLAEKIQVPQDRQRQLAPEFSRAGQSSVGSELGDIQRQIQEILNDGAERHKDGCLDVEELGKACGVTGKRVRIILDEQFKAGLIPDKNPTTPRDLPGGGRLLHLRPNTISTVIPAILKYRQAHHS